MRTTYVVVGVVACVSTASWAENPKTVSEDRAWASSRAVLQGTLEAEWIVRVGDVDNLGFGWPEGFDPFCGRMTEAHAFPWQPPATEAPGFDRILLSSKFNPARQRSGDCFGDGYSGAFDRTKSKPVVFELPTTALKATQVRNAFVQLFIDDFQAPSQCSTFQVLLNGKRFAEAEKILNAIDQTGPVGKLINLPVPEEFWAELTSKPKMTLAIDEVTGSADGFALDFVRLLVNRKRENTCKGQVHGRVIDQATQAPIANARVTLADHQSAQTDAEGAFTLGEVPAGFEVLTGSAAGYADGTASADVGPGDENAEVVIALEPAKVVTFGDQQLRVGEAFKLNSILFDQGKADLKRESKPELEKIVAFLRDNPGSEIELSGHTSSEGDAAMNRSLSYRRVKACKDFVVSQGLDAGRIIAVGFGPDRPVAPNETEAGRKLNRRVELRIVKIGR